MKKFLSKKPVMIAFIAAAVAFLAFYIATLAWPVSYHLPYKYEKNGMEVTYQFKSNKKIHGEMTIGGETIEMDSYYYRDGNLVFIIDADTEAEYKTEVEAKKALKKANKALYEEMATYEVNAFKLEMGDEAATNVGSIVLAVVGGVVALVLIAGATMSILYRRKK